MTEGEMTGECPDSSNVSPSSKPFQSAVGSPATSRLSLTPSVEWLDAYSEVMSDGNEIVTLAVDEIDEMDGEFSRDVGSSYQDISAPRRRLSRAQSNQSHKRIPSDLSDFPKLDLLYGPHLRFLHEEVGGNDLYIFISVYLCNRRGDS